MLKTPLSINYFQIQVLIDIGISIWSDVLVFLLEMIKKHWAQSEAS